MSDQFRAVWAGSSTQQKVSAAATLLAVLGSAIYIPFIIKAPAYGVLFSNVSDQEAGEIIARLRADGIPYKLAPSGKKILIPESKVQETRRQMTTAEVPGAGWDNASIPDGQSGMVPLGAGEDPALPPSDTRYGTALDVEKRLENKAQTMLDKVLGPHKSIVRVSVDIDPGRINTEESAVGPDGAAPAKKAGGIDPRGMSRREENAGSRAGKDAAADNNDDGKTIPPAMRDPEDIKRMTIAVVIDGKYRAYGSNPYEKVYIPRNEEEIMKLTDLVQGAVNFNSARGDEIKIQNIPFDTAYEEEIQKRPDVSGKEPKAGSGDPFRATAVKGGKVLALALVIFFGLRKIVGMRPKGTADKKTGAAVSAPVAEPPAAAVPRIPPVPACSAPNLEAEVIADNIKKIWLSS